MKYLSLGAIPLAASALALMTGCVVEPGRVYVRPPVVAVVAPPPPVVVAPEPVVVAPVVEVPDSYVLVDGVGYVGFVGDACFYLGPGNVWITCDPVRLGRFHDWERFHRDWRVHLAVRNDIYRRDRFGHEAPRHDVRQDHRDDRRQEKRDDHRDDHH